MTKIPGEEIYKGEPEKSLSAASRRPEHSPRHTEHPRPDVLARAGEDKEAREALIGSVMEYYGATLATDQITRERAEQFVDEVVWPHFPTRGKILEVDMRSIHSLSEEKPLRKTERERRLEQALEKIAALICLHDPEDKALAHVQKPPRELFADLTRIISTALAKDPARRKRKLNL